MDNILSCKTVLVTGGAGFIGSNLVRKLIADEYEVNLILKESTNPLRVKNILDRVKIHRLDILDKNALVKTVAKINPQIIFHLATYNRYRNQNESESMINVNIVGTFNLLMATKNINYKLFINTGSSSEYGFKEKPMQEMNLLEPASFYAATKASASLLCQVFSKEYQKPIVTLRPFSVYGPYEEKDRFIPTIIKAVVAGEKIKITAGDQRRDFIYIDDVVSIYLKTIKIGGSFSGEIFNMGTGIEYTNDQVVKTLFRIAGKKVAVEKGAFPKRLWDTSHWVADVTKTKHFLNWEPSFSLEDGLRKTYLWYKDEKFQS